MSSSAWDLGTFVSCIEYGIVVTLSFQCLSILVKSVSSFPHKFLPDGPLLIFVFAVFAVNTISLAVDIHLTRCVVDPTQIPPSHCDWFDLSRLNNLALLCNACSITSALLSDALLVRQHSPRCVLY